MKTLVHIALLGIAVVAVGLPSVVAANDDDSGVALQQSIDATLELVRASDRIEVFVSPPRRANQPPECVVTNAAEILPLVGAFDLPEPAKPPVPPCVFPHRMRFHAGDQVVSISFCDDVLLLHSSSRRSAVANRYYYRMPPDLRRRYHQYWLRYRPVPDAKLMGVSKTKDGRTEIIFQTRDGLRTHSVGDVIGGFRIVTIDDKQNEVQLRCVKSGRELWIK